MAMTPRRRPGVLRSPLGRARRKWRATAGSSAAAMRMPRSTASPAAPVGERWVSRALAIAPTAPTVAPTSTSGPSRVWARRTVSAVPAAAHSSTRIARTTSAELGSEPTRSEPMASTIAGIAAMTPMTGVGRTSGSPAASGIGTSGRSVTTAMLASQGSRLAASTQPSARRRVGARKHGVRS